MDVTTTIIDYLGYYNEDFNNFGKSFIVKSESGYYFPCHYAFISWNDEKPLLNFVKDLKYKNGRQYSYTQINILKEEPNFSTEILQNYEVPNEPFQPWLPPQQPAL